MTEARNEDRAAHDGTGQAPSEHAEALRRERRSQLRGLLLLAGAVLLFLIVRARPLFLFRHGW